MTLRSIEMQIALPRTNDVGQIQNQLSQKPAYDQNVLAQQNAKQADEQLKRSNKLDEASTLLVGEEDEKREGRGRKKSRTGGQGKDQQSSDETDKPVHPYKGHHIDLSL